MQTGAGLLPVSLLIGLMSLVFAPRLIARLGVLPVLIAAGLMLFGQVSPDGGYLTNVFPGTLPLGVGFGLAMPALAGLVMSGVDPRDSGTASGLFNTMQQIGSALGLSALSTLATSRTAGLVGRGADTAAALSSGYRLAFHVGAGLVAASLVVAVLVLRPERRAVTTAEAPGPVLEPTAGPKPLPEETAR
jgi:hypothetical protein